MMPIEIYGDGRGEDEGPADLDRGKERHTDSETALVTVLSSQCLI